MCPSFLQHALGKKNQKIATKKKQKIKNKTRTIGNFTLPYILVGGKPTPPKNMSLSVGMMKFPTEWKHKLHVPNHQSVYYSGSAFQ
jgi:glutaredoxin